MTPMVPSLGFQEGVAQPLERRFEVIKDVGDGSFGSVVLARVRGTRNTVAIKSMKKPFDSFSECLRLREVQSLRAIPRHPHIVPVLDAFLDPVTHKLHLVMELMEINLYQFLKSRDNRPLETRTVQVILWQVVSALQHIHAHGFFHRDIKPENVLISLIPQKPKPTSSSNSAQRLYTPPATPPAKSTPSSYLVKLADFGLAREIRSRPPYTSYVSTRWYRAPEVLLRAEEYSAPVDIWAMGAMAIEVATLRPIFPGTNEIDQLWRVCEVMGTPADWSTTDERTGKRVRIGGGSWSAGLKLAGNLSFKFPHVPPMDMTTILTAPWPKCLSEFVVACLSWDPKKRPTSTQCLNHEYFKEVERYLPLREPVASPPAVLSPTTSAPALGRKASIKGLGIEIPLPPRGARQQQPYVPYPTQQYQDSTHQQSSSQLQQSTQPAQSSQSNKGGWFKRDKKRDSSINLSTPAQAPQLPQLNLAPGPSLPAISPKPSPSLNGGMAFSPPKITKPEKVREERPTMAPPTQPSRTQDHARTKSWVDIQVPGQHRASDLPHLPSLPSIRPISPLQGDVFGANRKPIKDLSFPESPKREKSPVRQVLVNTFVQQALALERAEKEEKNLSPTLSSPKIGRQLSAASRDVPTRATQQSSPTSFEEESSSSSGKGGFFSHFRKRARKRMSVNGDEVVSPDAMPISPIPQLRPVQLSAGNSLRNSIVMEDFFEDAQEEIESDLSRAIKQVDEALFKGYKPGHITIAPAPNKGISSHPPSSHKNGTPPIPIKHTPRHVPSPYPTTVAETPPKLPPLTIPKRGSSRPHIERSDTNDSNTSRARRRPSHSPLPRILDDVILPGAYPLSASPDPSDRSSPAMSRSNTNLSVNLPGAYPRDRARYNSSSSGLSSAASYRTAFDPETWDSEEQRARDEQNQLQQSLMDATRAMRALEKHSLTDWTSGPSTWPTPPYDDDSTTVTANTNVIAKVVPPRGSSKPREDYFREM